jgi:spore coat polysaccharide biosynthesis protein SpsF
VVDTTNMKAAAIIQARMGSSRLPKKVLMPLAGRPVIAHIVDRARKIDGLVEVLVATTTSPSDDPLAAFCSERGIPVFRGSEQDVLERYYRAAHGLAVDAVMRITGDCPLLDPRESQRVLAAFLARPTCEYASNIEPPFLPDGLDTEVIRFDTLERIWREAKEPMYREHVTLYVRRHPDRFDTVSVRSSFDLSQLRWTLDEPADYTMLLEVTNELSRRGWFGSLDEVLTILLDRPEIGGINSALERDAALKHAIADAASERR